MNVRRERYDDDMMLRCFFLLQIFWSSNILHYSLLIHIPPVPSKKTNWGCCWGFVDFFPHRLSEQQQVQVVGHRKNGRWKNKEWKVCGRRAMQGKEMNKWMEREKEREKMEIHKWHRHFSSCSDMQTIRYTHGKDGRNEKEEKRPSSSSLF